MLPALSLATLSTGTHGLGLMLLKSKFNRRAAEIHRYRNWMSELIGADGELSRHGRTRFAPATVAKRLSLAPTAISSAGARSTPRRRSASRPRARRREPRGHAT